MSLRSDFFDIGWEPNAPRWNGDVITNHDLYDFAVIEFDDQGWYHNQDAQNRIVKYLEKKKGEKLTIIVFIHGWRHNASENDRNLNEFKSLLEDAAENEGYSASPGRVFGVYLAWRGLLSYGTFWTRKSAAFRVAVGSVREVLALLRRHQRDFNQPLSEDAVESGNGTRLVLVGHSFGGLILYSAVAEYLIDSVVRPEKKVVRPFGDLIILVNPAFEATRFQPLATAIRARSGFSPGQRVCFMAVTAKNDNATRMAFPIGRWFGTRLEATRENIYPDLPPRAQRDANSNTIGHLPWLTTHTLTAQSGANEKMLSIYEREKNAAKGTLRPSRSGEGADFAAFNARSRVDGRLQRGWERTYTSGAKLSHVAGDPGNPFWVVEAGSAEVIDGHNRIFQPVFLDFLRQVCDDRLRRKV